MNYWGVIFDRVSGPALYEISEGCWAYRNPRNRWFIMWPEDALKAMVGG